MLDETENALFYVYAFLHTKPVCVVCFATKLSAKLLKRNIGKGEYAVYSACLLQ